MDSIEISHEILTKNVNFYLDGTGFTHKHNPHDEARSTETIAWRGKSEGLNPLCTTKSKRAGTGGWMAHFMVALSPVHGVVLCRQYQCRLDGERFASMVYKLFPDVFKKTKHCEGRLFLQDGCPVQNSAATLKAMRKVKTHAFSIPLRSPYLNPIESFFNLLSKKLNDNVLENMITSESYDQFSERVKFTIENQRIEEIDKIVKSMPNRIQKILQRKGQRLQY